MHDVAAVLLDVELQEAVGIGPKPLRDGSLHGYPFVRIKSGVSVVRPDGNGRNQNKERPSYAVHKFNFHYPLHIKFLDPTQSCSTWRPASKLRTYFESMPAAGSANSLLYSSVSIGAHSISRISKVGTCSRNRSLTATQGRVYIFGSSIVMVISR